MPVHAIVGMTVPEPHPRYNVTSHVLFGLGARCPQFLLREQDRLQLLQAPARRRDHTTTAVQRAQRRRGTEFFGPSPVFTRGDDMSAANLMLARNMVPHVAFGPARAAHLHRGDRWSVLPRPIVTQATASGRDPRTHRRETRVIDLHRPARAPDPHQLPSTSCQYCRCL